MRRIAVLMLAAALAACGPQLGNLQKGETGRVVRVYNGDTLQLDSGLRVFLAEVDAPSGDQPYANQARAELEALAVNRTVELAYGGTRRWVRRAATTTTTSTAIPSDETAIAHVFVQSEGGRWFWLQHALVAKGAAMVRPRHDNHARTAQLLDVEAQARAAQRGLWALPAYRTLSAQTASRAALAYSDTCARGSAPYRILEAKIAQAQTFENRAALMLDGGDADKPFSVVLFGDSFTHWDGPPLDSLTGARIRARGTLGMFHDLPQLCLDDGSQLTVLHAR
jgi:endonuclease YncB( thermonuclease family)